MIGAAVLVTGLLLILAGFVSARIPGEASFASPGFVRSEGEDAAPGSIALGASVRRTLAAFALSPIHAATWRANGAIAIGVVVELVAFSIVVSLFSAGAPLLFAGIGFILFAIAIEGSRIFARVERWRAGIVDPTPLRPHPYRPLTGSLRDIVVAEYADLSRWRDVLYVAVNLPLAMVEFAVTATAWAVGLAMVTMPIWYDAVPGARLPGWLDPVSSHEPWLVVVRFLLGLVVLGVASSTSQITMALQRAVVAGLLCTSETRELQRRVESLQESRSAVIDAEASELRRIERDLHDGAQQRLVMLTIDLGMASERIDSDPAAAKRLVLEGQEQARQALAEIRDLVRGIAPAILLDRGLVPALSAVAARSPIPTAVVSELPEGERLPDAVERAAYFVVAEALANVAKHSSASRCEVRCRLSTGEARAAGGATAGGAGASGAGASGAGASGAFRSRSSRTSLVVEIQDDGVGGAQVCPGGGLAGLVGRVEALDGRLELSSPEGGPTVLRAELPLSAATRDQARDPGRPDEWHPARRM